MVHLGLFEVVPSTKTKGDKVPDPGGWNPNHLSVKVLGVTQGVALGPEVSPETTSNNVKYND